MNCASSCWPMCFKNPLNKIFDFFLWNSNPFGPELTTIIKGDIYSGSNREFNTKSMKRIEKNGNLRTYEFNFMICCEECDKSNILAADWN